VADEDRECTENAWKALSKIKQVHEVTRVTHVTHARYDIDKCLREKKQRYIKVENKSKTLKVKQVVIRSPTHKLEANPREIETRE